MPCASKTPDPRSRAGAGRLITALATALAATLAAPAWGGHESPFYPSYYPQEIRLETVAPEAAGRLLVNASIHAYVGGDPFAGRPGGDPPPASSPWSPLARTWSSRRTPRPGGWPPQRPGARWRRM